MKKDHLPYVLFLQEFHRDGDSNIVDQHKLPVAVSARYIRFHPTQQHEWNCLRVEVYGELTPSLLSYLPTLLTTLLDVLMT